jgi:hypothetical protein
MTSVSQQQFSSPLWGYKQHAHAHIINRPYHVKSVIRELMMNVVRHYVHGVFRQRNPFWIGTSCVYRMSMHNRVVSTSTARCCSIPVVGPTCHYDCGNRNRSSTFNHLYSYENSKHTHRFQYRNHFAASNTMRFVVERQMRRKERLYDKQMLKERGPSYRRRQLLKEEFPFNMVKIEFLHSIYDVQGYHQRYNLISEKRKRTRVDNDLNDDLPGTFRVEWNHKDILDLAKDYYGDEISIDTLEYYNHETNNWTPLPDDIESDSVLTTLYKGKGNRTMPLRMPSEYDDGQVSDEDIDIVDMALGKTTPERAQAEAVRMMIRRIVAVLHREKYVRVSSTSIGRPYDVEERITHSDEDTVTLTIVSNGDDVDDDAEVDDDADTVVLADNTNETAMTKENENSNDAEQESNDMIIVPTKQWIVTYALKDSFLASFLMAHPGALKHMVQCLHWDRVWNNTF